MYYGVAISILMISWLARAKLLLSVLWEREGKNLPSFLFWQDLPNGRAQSYF